MLHKKRPVRICYPREDDRIVLDRRWSATITRVLGLFEER